MGQAADINNVVEVGRIVRDSTLKYTDSGTPVSNFSIAVNLRVKEGETWGVEASFFDCAMFGKRAEGVNQYLLKGKQIAIRGFLEQQKWESKEGQSRSKVQIVVSDVQLLGGNRDD